MLSRRTFLAHATVGLSVASAACGRDGSLPTASAVAVGTSGSDQDRWAAVRQEFDLSDEYVHLGALLIASHPRRVRAAIDEYRRELDRNPVAYLVEHNRRLQAKAREAAAGYVGAAADEIALTDSTTMGLGLLYGGLRLRRDQEVLTTSNDYFATHEALRAASVSRGQSVREVPLYMHGEPVSTDQLVDRIVSAIRRGTRALALTWVHSGTGLRMPLTEIAAALGRVNADRREDDRALLCVDGVHGFGVEDATVADLGADFFAAGCHKWLFGPRGTGILWGRKEAWAAVTPTIPSFTDTEIWHSWLEDRDPSGPSTAARVTPGGFKAFEHLWATPEAFAFHAAIGKDRVAARTHQLARQLKEGLAAMPHVRLITPMDDRLSAGIVCFDVERMPPRTVVGRLLDQGIIATVTPYVNMHARLTPSILNTEEEIDRALAAVYGLT